MFALNTGGASGLYSFLFEPRTGGSPAALAYQKTREVECLLETGGLGAMEVGCLRWRTRGLGAIA